MAITGGCLCGQVRYRIEAEPAAARLCWCRDCQYWAAGSATFNILFPREAMVLTGELGWYRSDADSGNPMKRGFCPTCGTPIISDAQDPPPGGMIRVRGGTLDDLSLITPQAVIWTSSAPAWAHIDPNLPHFERQPPPAI